MKYIRNFTLNELLNNVQYSYPSLGLNPTKSKAISETTDLLQKHFLFMDFMYNWCSGDACIASIRLEINKMFLADVITQVRTGDIESVFSEYFVLQQMCAHSDEYFLNIKPELKTTESDCNVLGEIFNNVDIYKKLPQDLRDDYQRYLNGLVEYGETGEWLAREIDNHAVIRNQVGRVHSRYY